MPLHDWSDQPGWEGVHHLWMAELVHHLRATLPPGYRPTIGATPTFNISSVEESKPDVAVRNWPANGHPSPTGPNVVEPDEEIAVATLQADTAVLVEQAGRLVAAIELVSPRNKDRHAAQASYALTYASYLIRGVHLVLVDVHPKPLQFSFADQLATELGLQSRSLPAPFAVSYRVGGPAPMGGRFLATWRRVLHSGEPLPAMVLPLVGDETATVDLEGTYTRAASAAYLS